MSDDERLNLRDLPPVTERVELPERLSQTLLSHANWCKRAAYLYLLRGGGTPAHELDFGTACHLVWERMMTDLIAAGEKTLYAPAEGEDPTQAARAVASLTAAIVDEVLRERPDLTVPVTHKTHSVDHIREQAYHWAIACDIDPDTVLALEQKIVLTLPSGIVISGKLDVAEYLGGGLYGVDDYKSGFAAKSEGELEEAFQLKLYALLLAFGTPLSPDGRSLPKHDGVQWVRARELYPRLKPRDGRLRESTVTYSRQVLADWIPDLDLLATDLAERVESGKFPAIPSSWCSSCPSSAECPLPPVLRRHAGTINEMHEAREAAEWVETTKPQIAATERELRAFAKRHGPIRYGVDRVREFEEQTSWKTDWESLEIAVAESTNFGVPFDLSAHRKPQISTRFVARTLAPAELEADEQEEVLTDGSRFGDDPPW